MLGAVAGGIFIPTSSRPRLKVGEHKLKMSENSKGVVSPECRSRGFCLVRQFGPCNACCIDCGKEGDPKWGSLQLQHEGTAIIRAAEAPKANVVAVAGGAT